jgi:hypothetical protein
MSIPVAHIQKLQPLAAQQVHLAAQRQAVVWQQQQVAATHWHHQLVSTQAVEQQPQSMAAHAITAHQ